MLRPYLARRCFLILWGSVIKLQSGDYNPKKWASSFSGINSSTRVPSAWVLQVRPTTGFPAAFLSYGTGLQFSFLRTVSFNLLIIDAGGREWVPFHNNVLSAQQNWQIRHSKFTKGKKMGSKMKGKVHPFTSKLSYSLASWKWIPFLWLTHLTWLFQGLVPFQSDSYIRDCIRTLNCCNKYIINRQTSNQLAYHVLYFLN